MVGEESNANQQPKTFSVLFVCLGNICRSPMAGAVFAHVVNQCGLSAHFARIESAGTGDYHIGEEPDERTIETCRRHGVPVNSLAQQISTEHYYEFDYILAMDRQNLANLQRKKPPLAKAQVRLFGAFGDNKDIADPYYGRRNGFEETYNQVVKYSDGFLEAVGFGSGNVPLVKV